METWKVMLWIAFVLASFVVFATLTDTSLASAGGLGILIGAIIAGLLAHFGTNKGYAIGRRLAGERRDDEK